MSWFKKLLPSRIRTDAVNKKGVPEGLWSKCDKCASVLYRSELERNLEVCPKCSYHMRISARKRLEYFLDEGPQVEIGADRFGERPIAVAGQYLHAEYLGRAGTGRTGRIASPSGGSGADFSHALQFCKLRDLSTKARCFRRLFRTAR